MARNFMPQSGALAPYVVVNRDAAVAGVFSVDGLRGSVDLTTKYLTIANFNAYKTTTDGSISSINQSITALNTAVSNKAAKGANSDITSITGLTTALGIAYGGTGGKTAAEARTNLGLTTAATTSIGTDGARIPLLNGVNTWATNQTFSGTQTIFSNINPGGIEIGSYGTAGVAYIDLHSSGTGNDYDVRIRSDGGNNTAGRGTLSIAADLVKLPALELTSPLGIAYGGTGAVSAEGARTNLGLGTNANAVFSNLSVPNGIYITTSDSGSNPSAPIVAKIMAANGTDTLGQAEFRADRNGNLSLINRTDPSRPQFMTLDTTGMLSAPAFQASGTSRLSSLEVGITTPNTASFIDWHYSGSYDYDFRILCSSSGSGIGKGAVNFYGGVYTFAGDSFIFNNPITSQNTITAEGELRGASVRTTSGTALRSGTSNGCYASVSAESGYVLLWRRNDPGTKSDEFLGIRNTGDAIFRQSTGASTYVDRIIWHQGNTTVDANGFIKRASPIVKIFNDDFSVNEESEGCTVTHVETGVYRINGCLGLSADLAWGGVNGGIEVPKDINGQPLLWVDYKVDSEGTIILKTYHREHPESPAFAQNKREGYSNGDPIDIPFDVFVSVRVEMPEDSKYNLWKQQEAKLNAESEEE
ncbi:hypothetical protein U7154_000104 [Kononvirus KKP3711]|uniref:Phage tail protein C-terminal domain-containing protein n=1 Tax=Enterobacter phage KKP_3711 TaxID=3109398 RepID=A0AAX4Q4Y1_9CAUD